MTEDQLCTVAGCDRPTHDGWYVCEPCGRELAERLAETRWMLDELDIVITKQTRYTTSAGKIARASDEQPIPFNVKASEQRRYLVTAIATAARLVIDEHPEWLTDRFWAKHDEHRRDSPAVAAAWLEHRIAGLRLHPLGGQARDEIMRHWSTCTWLIDRPRDRRYLGTCKTNWQGNECGGRIFQHNGAPEAHCDICGGEYEAEALTEVLIAEASGSLVTASEAAMLAMMLALPVGRTEVRRLVNVWVSRGVVETRDHASENGHPRVRFGDVTIRLIEKFETEDTRAS